MWGNHELTLAEVMEEEEEEEEERQLWHGNAYTHVQRTSACTCGAAKPAWDSAQLMLAMPPTPRSV